MDQWPCRLEAQDPSYPEEVAAGLMVIPEDPDPAGTFSVPGDHSEGALITYDPDLISRPQELVAAFAHELAHYLVSTAQEFPPGGEAFTEQATDLAAVCMGFGVFLANAAFHFGQFQEGRWIGWRSRQQGYLGEAELAFGLAVFVRLHHLDPTVVQPHLDRNPRSYFKKALRLLAGAESEIARLESAARHEGAV